MAENEWFLALKSKEIRHILAIGHKITGKQKKSEQFNGENKNLRKIKCFQQ